MSVPKPKVVVSSCLLGERVRYDGRSAKDELIISMLEGLEVVPVCPEVSVGLGVPREKIVVYLDNGELRVSQPATGLELTERLREFCIRTIRSIGEVEGFILKSKSPSCGVSRTKTYKDPQGKLYRGLGKGLFASEIIRRFPYIPVEDEIRLRHGNRRLEFLVKVWLLRNLRENRGRVRDVLEVLRVWRPRLSTRIGKLLTEGKLKEAEPLAIGSIRGLPGGVLSLLLEMLRS